MDRFTGVWLDLDQALIYHLQKDKNNFEIVTSEMDHYHLVGGSGNETPNGPQEAVSESKFLERTKHQKKDYFKRVAQCLTESTEVVLMGPAEIKFGLNTHLNESHMKDYMLHKPITQDSMTENQVKAAIRGYYKKKKKK